MKKREPWRWRRGFIEAGGTKGIYFVEQIFTESTSYFRVSSGIGLLLRVRNGDWLFKTYSALYLSHSPSLFLPFNFPIFSRALAAATEPTEGYILKRARMKYKIQSSSMRNKLSWLWKRCGKDDGCKGKCVWQLLLRSCLIDNTGIDI